jgi:isopentenyl-diphosphate delta-isomerase
MNGNYKYLSNTLKNTNANMLKKYFSESVNSKPNELQNLLKKVDDSQKMSFEEKLILVDENDNKISSTSKIDAHLRIVNNKYPHRAFSVFMFDQNNELLLQKRSDKKITFKNLWSNTCCSHPIDNEDENVMNDNIGIRKAATRRIKFELGMDTRIDQYFVSERILYRADSDDIFEEFELDYILLAKLNMDIKEIAKSSNPDEVSDVRLISKKDLVDEVNSEKMMITPWFKLIVNNKIDEIYETAKNLENIVKDVKQELKIVRYI